MFELTECVKCRTSCPIKDRDGLCQIACIIDSIERGPVYVRIIGKCISCGRVKCPRPGYKRLNKYNYDAGCKYWQKQKREK